MYMPDRLFGLIKDFKDGTLSPDEFIAEVRIIAEELDTMLEDPETRSLSTLGWLTANSGRDEVRVEASKILLEHSRTRKRGWFR